MKLKDIKPNEGNPRQIQKAKLEKLAKSIEEFPKMMELRPIVVDTNGVILGGNMRYQAIKFLKMKEIPDTWVKVAEELSKEEQERFIIEDNVSFGEWDFDILANQWDPDSLLDWGLDIPNFASGPNEGLTDDDALPEAPKIAKTKPGDIYLLDDHRLLCGDATSIADVEKLMAGKKADMIFTDPPYNVDYEGYTEEKLKIEGDKMTTDAYLEFLKSSLLAQVKVMKSTAGMYLCHASAYQSTVEQALNIAGLEVRNQIIWAKNTFAWGRGRYKYQHEPIFYAFIKGKSDKWYGDKSQTTLWMENKPAANRLHPTMKPVEIVLRAITNSSKEDDLLLDCFAGSGTTYIAAEKSGRRCFGMEIDPIYCDVIVKRWEEFTGKKAKKA